MEQNMEVVSTVLSNLKNMAIDMETELGVHSEQVKLINNMVRRNSKVFTEFHHIMENKTLA